MNSDVEATLAIARRKVVTGGESGARIRYPRLGTGGEFRDIFLWDTAFAILWAQYDPERLPIENSLDNFYLCASGDGLICRQYSPEGWPKWSSRHPIAFAPPLLAWAELSLAEKGLFPDRLERVYPQLVRHHEFCRTHYRRDDGFYFSDAWGCGMDNAPRWAAGSGPVRDGGIELAMSDVWPETPGAAGAFGRSLCDNPLYSWNRQLIWIDTNCQVAFELLTLARIADRLKRSGDASRFREEHAGLAAAINSRCYSEEDGFYYDVVDGSGFTRRRHVGAFWSLLGEVATPERADRLAEKLEDPTEFGRPVPVPSLSAADPDYAPENGYWQGPVWAPTTYMVLGGLRTYGKHDLAGRLAQRYCEAVHRLLDRTGTLWENISPEQSEMPPSRSQPDFCGWSALGPLTIAREFLSQ